MVLGIGTTPTGDRGVSPVLAEIIMVGIAIVLAFLVAPAVLNIAQSVGLVAPMASLTVDLDVADSNVTLIHEGGDALVDNDTRILLTNQSSGTALEFIPDGGPTTWTAGEQIVLSTNDGRLSGSQGGWTGRTADGERFDLAEGHRYTVKIIDTNSQKPVFRRDVVA